MIISVDCGEQWFRQEVNTPETAMKELSEIIDSTALKVIVIKDDGVTKEESRTDKAKSYIIGNKSVTLSDEDVERAKLIIDALRGLTISSANDFLDTCKEMLLTMKVL